MPTRSGGGKQRTQWITEEQKQTAADAVTESYSAENKRTNRKETRNR